MADTEGIAPNLTADTFWLATRRPCTPAPKVALLREVKLVLATAVAMAIALPTTTAAILSQLYTPLSIRSITPKADTRIGDDCTQA